MKIAGVEVFINVNSTSVESIRTCFLNTNHIERPGIKESSKQSYMSKIWEDFGKQILLYSVRKC